MAGLTADPPGVGLYNIWLPPTPFGVGLLLGMPAFTVDVTE